MKAPETLQFPELTHHDPDWIPTLLEVRKNLQKPTCCSYTKGACDWKESLIERPKN